jgi:hypothetical protein
MADGLLLNGRSVMLVCPICHEKFHPPNVEITNLFLTSPPDANATQRPYPKYQQNVNAIANSKSALTRGGVLEDFKNCAPVTPQTIPAAFWRTTWLGALIIAVIVALAFGFTRSVVPPAEAVISEVSNTNDSYALSILPKDLLSLRNEHSYKRKISSIIDYKSKEIRVYKHIIQELAPFYCQELSSIHLLSHKPSESIKMRGVCKDKTMASANIEIKWVNNVAVIDVINHIHKLEQLVVEL